MPHAFFSAAVEDIVRELLLAHARPGLHKVYDFHAYEKEKADALKLWHEKLKISLEGNWFCSSAEAKRKVISLN